MQNVIMLNAVMLSVIMLSVMAPFQQRLHRQLVKVIGQFYKKITIVALGVAAW